MWRNKRFWLVLMAVMTLAWAERVDAQAKPDAPKAGDKLTPKELKALQGGEPVLPAASAPADAPRRRAPGLPWIELADLRRGARNKLVVDYVVTEGKAATFILVLKSIKGRSTVPVTAVREGVGEIEFDPPAEKLEIWAEWTPPAPRPLLVNAQSKAPPLWPVKVSKSITQGVVGKLTYARDWSLAERTAFDEYHKDTAPPPPPPEGYEVLTAQTEPLLPGMPVRVAIRGEWLRGELLATLHSTPVVKWTASGSSSPTIQSVSPAAVAITAGTLATGRTDPKSFKPSTTLFPRSSQPLPKDARLLPPEIALVTGTPLLTSSGKVLFDLEDPDGSLYVLDGRGFFRRMKVERDAVAILETTLEQLKKPDAAAEFAKEHTRIAETIRREEAASQRRSDNAGKFHEQAMQQAKAQQQQFQQKMQQDKGQPPAGFFSVKPGVAIPKGTSVLFFDSFSWRSGLVLQPANGDSVTIIQDGPIAGRQLQLPRDKVLVHLEQATDLEKGLGLDGPPNMKYDLVLEKSNVFATHVLVDALKMEHREAMSFNNLAEPEVVKSDLELRQARAIQIKLTAAGATASIRPKK